MSLPAGRKLQGHGPTGMGRVREKDQPSIPLKQALGLEERETISLVGAGGKTSLLFLLARELSSSGYRVITTTTTKIFEPAPGQTPFLSLGETSETILRRVASHGHITVASKRVAHGKLQGIPPDQVEELRESALVDYIIVEADGAAQRPLKAPESYEPVIPGCTGTVVGLVGADAFGVRLTEATVFRSHIFSRITGLSPGAEITCEAVCLAFTHAEGILKGTPRSARVVIFFNKVDLDGGLAKGKEFAAKILGFPGSTVERVVLGHLRSERPVVEVVSRGW